MTNELKTERLEQSRLGVFEETAQLRHVLMWGPPGVEAALAQLLPPEISCFYQTFDVAKARSEFVGAQGLIDRATNGTAKITLVKDLFASVVRMDGNVRMDLATLEDELTRRADEFYQRYSPEYAEGHRPDLNQVKDWMRLCLYEDVDKYGEEEAVEMNRRLANLDGLPLANILYFRDQSSVAGNVWIWSQMKHQIRQPEVALCKEIIARSGIIPSDMIQVQVTGDGRFEGGDLIMTDGLCYIGVGGRTNLEGVKQIAPYLIRQNTPVVIAYDERRDKGLDSEMGAMHQDTYSMPIDRGTWVACPTEVDRRFVKRTELIGNTVYFKDWGPLSEFFKMREVDIVPITEEEQQRHASNLVNLGLKTAILTLNSPDLNSKLTEQHLKIYNADLKTITDGFGGEHCMCAPIKRG